MRSLLRKLNPLIHVVGVAMFAWAIWFQMTSIKITHEQVVQFPHIGLDKFGGPLNYLTYWNLWIQLFYYAMALKNDLFKGIRKEGGRNTNQRIFEDHYFASLTFPLGVFVVTVFWGFYTVDRELVYPVFWDRFVPDWLNHFMHTWPLALILLEMISARHEYPAPAYKGAGITMAVCVVYLIWISLIAYFEDFWVYPILGALSFVPRTLFMSSSIVMAIALYHLGESLNRYIWSIVPGAAKKTRK